MSSLLFWNGASIRLTGLILALPHSFPISFFSFVSRFVYLFSRGFRCSAGPCQSHVCVGYPTPSSFAFSCFLPLLPVARSHSDSSSLLSSLPCSVFCVNAFSFCFFFCLLSRWNNAGIHSLDFHFIFCYCLLLGRLSWFRWPACFTWHCRSASCRDSFRCEAAQRRRKHGRGPGGDRVGDRLPFVLRRGEAWAPARRAPMGPLEPRHRPSGAP